MPADNRHSDIRWVQTITTLRYLRYLSQFCIKLSADTTMKGSVGNDAFGQNTHHTNPLVLPSTTTSTPFSCQVRRPAWALQPCTGSIISRAFPPRLPSFASLSHCSGLRLPHPPAQYIPPLPLPPLPFFSHDCTTDVRFKLHICDKARLVMYQVLVLM